MESSPVSLKHRELTEKIVGAFCDVFHELGHGFLERVCEQALAIALAQAGIKGERQVAVAVWFRGPADRGQQIEDFRADRLIDRSVRLELKAAGTIDQAPEKQLLNYLRATDGEVGLLLNFGVRAQFRRLVHGKERKKIRVDPPASAAI
jgi:GxxExxY protein